MTLDEELWIKNQNSSVWEPLVIWIWNGIVKDGLSVLLGLPGKMQHFAFDIQLLSAVCSCVKSNLHYRFELLEIISAILCSLSLWNLNSWQAPRSDQPTQSFPLGVGLNADLISTWEDIDNFFIFDRSSCVLIGDNSARRPYSLPLLPQ